MVIRSGLEEAVHLAGVVVQVGLQEVEGVGETPQPHQGVAEDHSPTRTWLDGVQFRLVATRVRL
jgi:hypothetical protein